MGWAAIIALLLPLLERFIQLILDRIAAGRQPSKYEQRAIRRVAKLGGKVRQMAQEMNIELEDEDE